MCFDESKLCIKHNSYRDTRTIEFWEDFKEGNQLYEFTKLIQSQPELQLLFRGNGNEPSATIYRDNHMVWNIKKITDGYEIKINFAHAKYYTDHDCLKKKLKNLNFEFDEKEYAKCKVSSLEEVKNVVGTYEDVMQKMFDTFFEYKNNTKAYFKASKRVKKPEIEKIFQQYLFTNVLNGEDKSNGYYAFDMEFQQPYPCTAYRDSRGDTNKPDMLAIKFENNEYKLVLIEVKSKYSSCGGSSGFDKHLDGMGKYLEEQIFGEYVIINRMKDAIKIIKTYKELEIKGFNNGAIPYCLNKFFEHDFTIDKFKGYEILFIFTDEIIDSECENYNYVPKANEANGSIKWLEFLKEGKRKGWAEAKQNVLKKIDEIKTKEYKGPLDDNIMKANIKFMTFTKKLGLTEVSL